MDTSKKKIWILDDDKSIRWVLQKALEKNNYNVLAFGNTNEAINHFNHDMPDLIISDIKMPGESGLQFLEKVKVKFPNIPVIIMTAFSDLDSAIDSYSHGAYEYLPKPFDIDNAIRVINSAFKDNKEDLNEIESSNKIIGTSKVMQDVFKQIGKLSKSDASILITGESGTGKELVAKAIHDNSSRKDKPFVALNSAAIPKDLLESELFGYEKGAFTGALKTTQGKFEQAHKGTLFLDEIGDMPAALQTKLLRVLENSTITRVGSTKDIKLVVRVVCATHKNLDELVTEKIFREDLLFRLNVFPINVPALVDRREDIPDLINHFLNQKKRFDQNIVPQFDEEAFDDLKNYS